MPPPLETVVQGFSRAMFSNWLWHRPLQLVVDAGEGLQLGLGSRLLQPTHLLVTHGHSDHVLGLPGFVSARRFALGDPDKPLTILYPDGAAGITAMRETLGRLWPGEAFPVRWVPVAPGDAHPLGPKHEVHAFAVTHPGGGPAVGYRVLERRRRLRAEFRGLSSTEVSALAAEGRRDEVIEEYRHVLFAHTGDTMPLDPDLFRDADLLVHDATFLDPDDRAEPIHATTGEAIAAGRDAGVARLLLQHLSVRYARDEALPRLREEVRRLGYVGECWLLDGAELVPVATRVSLPGP